MHVRLVIAHTFAIVIWGLIAAGRTLSRRRTYLKPQGGTPQDESNESSVFSPTVQVPYQFTATGTIARLGILFLFRKQDPTKTKFHTVSMLLIIEHMHHHEGLQVSLSHTFPR